MGIEIRIEAANAEELRKQMATLIGGPAVSFTPSPSTTDEPEPQPEPQVEEKPRRQPRKAKAEEPESPKPEPTGSTESSTPSSGTRSDPTADGAPTQDNDEPQVVYADVQKAVSGLAVAKGRDAVMAVLNKFDVDHGTKLKPEQWADAVAELDAAKAA